MLTAQEAIELSVAFPYARGRYQQLLGERVLVNDLYGTPCTNRPRETSNHVTCLEFSLLPQSSRPRGRTPSSSSIEPSGPLRGPELMKSNTDPDVTLG